RGRQTRSRQKRSRPLLTKLQLRVASDIVGQVVTRFPLGKKTPFFVQILYLLGRHSADQFILSLKLSAYHRTHPNDAFGRDRRSRSNADLGTEIGPFPYRNRRRLLPVMRPY